MLVTYEPYVSQLEKLGFTKVDSTKDLGLLVLDALFVKRTVLETEQERFRQLKGFLERALERLETDPEEYYRTVAPYLDNQGYDDFAASLGEIRWLLRQVPPEERKALEAHKIPTDRIIW